MNDSTAKVDWSRMSPAAKARAHRLHPTVAGSRGVIPMHEAARYAAGSEEVEPEPRQPAKVPLEAIERTVGGWTIEMDRTLLRMKRQHAGKREIAQAVNRSPSAVDARFQKLQDMDCV